MHNSIDEFIAANTQYCSKSRAANENGKRFEIVSQEDFTKIRIDGGVIASQQVGKCDFGFARHSNNDFYFVELKGKDIDTAFEQLKSTINIFDQQFIKIAKNQRFGFIVSSKIPKSGTDINNLKQKFAKDLGKILKIQNRELKHKPE
jgi:uncharacterized protein YjbI with pentapeptide repeats